MNYEFGPYTVILALTTAIALILAFVIWRRRDAPGAGYLALLELAAAEWAFSVVFEMAATTVPLKILWSQISYVGITTTPILFFLFAMAYSRPRAGLSRRSIPLLFVIPALTFVVILVDRLRPWHWSSVVIDPATNIATYGHGPWFWVFLIYCYALLAIGAIRLLGTARRFATYYRRQTAALVIGAMLPLAGNIMYVSGLNPIRSVDWTPISFALTGVVLAWGLFGLKMFRLVPIAREQLVEEMRDGLVVLDADNRVVDVNPAAETILGRPAGGVVGTLATEGVAQLNGLAVLLTAGDETSTWEISLGEGKARQYYDLRLSPLRDWRGRLTGHLLVMRDTTRRKQMEEERESLIQSLSDALAQVKTLHGLLPICAQCKRIRDDDGYWHSVEEYLSHHSDVDFSHSICPDCAAKLYPDLFKEQALDE